MQHCVYFVQQENGRRGRSPMKIGYSSNVSQRLIDLQTASPTKLKLRATILCETEKEARTLERALHWMAERKSKRLNGEWFIIFCSFKDLIEAAIKKCQLDIEGSDVLFGRHARKASKDHLLLK